MMHIEQFREFCLSKKGVTESFPFDQDVLVFKVLNKMFALTSLSALEFKVSLKCDPDKAILLREEFKSIIPAFHMNKKHWNAVNVETLYNNNLFIELINHSYDLVVKGMTKKDRLLLVNLNELENNKQN
jgi:predicted DNA-binding protein (MmcQ/YjbR family)